MIFTIYNTYSEWKQINSGCLQYYWVKRLIIKNKQRVIYEKSYWISIYFFMLVSCGSDYKKYEELQKEIVKINQVVSEYRNQALEKVIRREPMVFFQIEFEEFKKIKLEKVEFPELNIDKNQLVEISKKIEYLKKNLSVDEKTLNI